MLKRYVAGFSVLACISCAGLAHAVWSFSPKAFAGSYAIYGGVLNDQESRAPSRGDAKIAFNIRGEAAREIFDSIGPNRARLAPAESLCPGNPTIRVRERDSLVCRHHPRDGYWCAFGFDLGTGLSTWGTVSGAMCESVWQ